MTPLWRNDSLTITFLVKIPLGQQILMDSSSRDTSSSETDAKQKGMIHTIWPQKHCSKNVKNNIFEGVNEKENFSGNSQPMLSSEDHEAS